jgi:hypothetical protein
MVQALLVMYSKVTVSFTLEDMLNWLKHTGMVCDSKTGTINAHREEHGHVLLLVTVVLRDKRWIIWLMSYGDVWYQL